MSLVDSTAHVPRAVRVASRQRPPIAGFRDPRIVYLGLAAGVFLAMVGHTLNENWSAPDFWVYLAAVEEFADHPVDPAHPFLVGQAADPYLSPYTWVLGVISRLTGLGGITVLAGAGLVNLTLLLVGLYRLVTTLSPQRYAPSMALLFTLFAWGVPTWRWAGYFNANSIGSVLPLASTFAAGLALFALSATWRWLHSGTRAYLAVVAVTVPLILTTHPFTAMWAAALGLGFVVAAGGRGNRRQLVALAGVAGCAAALTLAWPFYPVAELPGSSGDLDAINSGVLSGVVPRAFLALPGVVALGYRFRERRRDPLVLGAAFAALVFAAGWILDRSTLGRALPAVMLMLHIAMADFLARYLEAAGPGRRRTATITAVSVVLVIGIAGTAAGSVRAVPRLLLPGGLGDRDELQSLVDPYLPLGEVIPRDDVVVASSNFVLPIGALGGKVVAPPRSLPAPFVDDLAERQRATDTVLDPDLPAVERRAVLDDHGVDWVVLRPAEADRWRRDGAFADGSLVPERATDDFVIIRVAG